MDLCRCPAPLRDATLPTRRLWCSRCGGATTYGRRHSLNATQALIARSQSLLAKLADDMRLGTESVYGIQATLDGGGRAGGHSAPTERITSDRRDDAATYLALAAKWIETSLAMLVNADEAAGSALWATDPHRGPVDHVRAAYHDTIPTGRPDLESAYEAKAKRRGRGEL